MKVKPTHFFFCFHPKFDTGTWSIAVAFATAVMFSAMFTMALSYSAPNCFCPQLWEHLNVLPTAFKVIYVFVLLFLAAVVTSSVLAIYGTFKAQHSKLSYYIVLMIVTEIGTIGGSIFGFIQIARFEENLLFDNETYWNMAKMVLKEDLVIQIENMMETVTALLKSTLHFDMTEALNLDSLMDAALKEGVLVVLGGMKMMMKVSSILIIIGLNTLFITSILVVGSHYRRLKRGILRTYTGVPGMVITKAVLTTSARSTASDSLSDDWSGTPLRKLQRMKSKDYNSSTRSSKRLYNTDKLSVEEKFPKGDFL